MKEYATFNDFMKLDIRVGEVIEASQVENSNKLLELTINFGDEIGQRTILTGMQKWYAPDDFQGKKFLFIVNLEPRKMAGKESQGMLLSADVDGEPKLISVSTSLPNGTSIL